MRNYTFLSMFRKYVNSSLILIIVTILALVVANSGWGDAYRALWDKPYSPDYSQKPLPDTKDYRRTLYWMPNVKFDSEGKATVNLYNNSKPTVLSIQAEGITTTGTPIVWNSKN